MSHRQKVWTSARSLQDQLPWGDVRPLDVLDKRDLCLPLPASPLLRVRGHLLPETNATIEGLGMWLRSCTSLKTLSYSSSDFFVIIICSDRVEVLHWNRWTRNGTLRKILQHCPHWTLLSGYMRLIWARQYWVWKVRLVWRSEKGVGLKKGEISKGEKWLSLACMYYTACLLSANGVPS